MPYYLVKQITTYGPPDPKTGEQPISIGPQIGGGGCGDTDGTNYLWWSPTSVPGMAALTLQQVSDEVKRRNPLATAAGFAQILSDVESWSHDLDDYNKRMAEAQRAANARAGKVVQAPVVAKIPTVKLPQPKVA